MCGKLNERKFSLTLISFSLARSSRFVYLKGIAMCELGGQGQE